MHVKDGIKSTWTKQDVSKAGSLASLLGPFWNMPPESSTANTALAFLYLPVGRWYPESRGVSASAGAGVPRAGREELLLCASLWSQQLRPMLLLSREMQGWPCLHLGLAQLPELTQERVIICNLKSGNVSS